MINTLKNVSYKFGLTPYVKRLLNSFYQNRAMRFPSFPAELHQSIVSHRDYYRFATLGLAIQRVLSDRVGGAFAEVGVYRGEMSRFIHALAPERTYYLFDTFEGFPAQDLEANAKDDTRFRDTSVEAVLQNIGDSRNIVVKQGYVPETLMGLEQETFAFVLLDLDLYNPTKRSLEFFYPRLSSGGYIIIHDYNSPESDWACNRAVNEFMDGKPEHVIEIADLWGTSLFRKHG